MKYIYEIYEIHRYYEIVTKAAACPRRMALVCAHTLSLGSSFRALNRSTSWTDTGTIKKNAIV